MNFLIFLVAAMIVFIFLSSDKSIAFFRGRLKHNKSFSLMIQNFFKHLLIPHEDSKRYIRISKSLRNSIYSVKSYYLFKYIVTIVVIICFFGFHFFKLNIVSDQIYEFLDSGRTLELMASGESTEIFLFDFSVRHLDPSLVLDHDSSALVKDTIRQYVFLNDLNIDFHSIDSVVNKIYDMCNMYFNASKIKWVNLVVIAILGFSFVDLHVAFSKIGIKDKREFEILKLEQTFMLHGTLKSSNFNTLISELIDDSHYYKDELVNIKINVSKLQKNGIDTLLSRLDDNERHFFEKVILAYDGKMENVVRRLKSKSITNSMRIETKQLKEMELLGIQQSLLFVMIMGLVLFKVMYPFLQLSKINMGLGI